MHHIVAEINRDLNKAMTGYLLFASILGQRANRRFHCSLKAKIRQVLVRASQHGYFILPLNLIS